MIDAKRLLLDLKRLRKGLEGDLRQHHGAGSPGWAAVRGEWEEAHAARRTGDVWEAFLSAAVDQAAVHWILAACFLRFLEDNGLVERPMLAGPGERGELALARQDAYFRARPEHSDAEYLPSLLAEAAGLPGLGGIFDAGHNPLFRLPLSGDGAGELIRFFRATVPETGALVRDFRDEGWGGAAGTRWLGDLYQDLSEDARKRYALLQTPEFVEAWILDRTLEPALRAFPPAEVRMLDPSCGSGHFLLGGFARLLREAVAADPGAPPPALAQRALDGVAGVDLNPFAVEVARFRLLVAALRAAGEARLADAPDFRIHLAVGDSLLHGKHFGAQRTLGEGAEAGFGRRQRHAYAAEDRAAADRLLGRQYHAVVGNPPYITPKDPAMREAYREIYQGCRGTYGLGVPFTERFFDLALPGGAGQPPGYVGLIVANSFMKREFGKALIQEVLPRLDLTHVVDCSGAYIPGHGTPTVILFGRNRTPLERVVRTVMGIRGEPGTPEDPAQGLVWSAITAQADLPGSSSAFVSVEDVPRATLARHPWSIAGGGAGDVKEIIEEGRDALLALRPDIGFASFPGADDVFIAPARAYTRAGVPDACVRPIVLGDQVRDWDVAPGEGALVPYGAELELVPLDALGTGARLVWRYRTTLGGIMSFGGMTKAQLGAPWWGWYRWVSERYRTPLTITFGEVATHNHFVLDWGGKVFNRTAPVIKLPEGAGEDEHLGLLGLLNSSVACFWLKQVCYPKGGDHVGQEGARVQKTKWDERYAFNGSNIERFPVAEQPPVDLARALDGAAQRLSASLPAAVAAAGTPTRAALDAARTEAEAARGRMVALQEELDWRCYRLYGLLDDPPEHPHPPPLRLGQRAFEVVMARQVAAGEPETAWFARHHSTPVTELPAEWPAEYRALVERRIALIQSDPTIGLLERPEHKRRWSAPAWEEQERDTLRAWLGDRLESRRYWPEGEPAILSARQLADLAHGDAEFVAVAGLLGGGGAAGLEGLVGELAGAEGVPFLAALRYAEGGQRKRAEWEAAWDKQREEDRIDADVEARRREYEAQVRERLQRDGEASPLPQAVDDVANRFIAAEQAKRKLAEVGRIPLPPKYVKADFLSNEGWRLRGGLDVPKERFVTFPHCARDTDGSLPLLWAGYDDLERARAIAALYLERKDVDGWPPARLAPLLAGVAELLPWLRQWHDGYDPATGFRMGEYFTGFVRDEAQAIGLTEAELPLWRPPLPARRTRNTGRRAA